jgi:hypothetical protein
MTGFGNGNIVSTPRKRAHVIFAFCHRPAQRFKPDRFYLCETGAANEKKL